MVAGLIIDAFGELRDQQEQVKEDMEVRVDFFLTHTCQSMEVQKKLGWIEIWDVAYVKSFSTALW